MEFEMNGVSSIQMTNSETGETIDFGEPISVSNDFKLQPDRQNLFSNTINSSIEFSCDDMKADGLCKLLKPKFDNTTYAMMDIPTYKQARVHKKKRINKKWLKRYGYKIVMKSVKAKILKISADDFPKGSQADFELEFSPEDLRTLCESSTGTKQ